MDNPIEDIKADLERFTKARVDMPESKRSDLVGKYVADVQTLLDEIESIEAQTVRQNKRISALFEERDHLKKEIEALQERLRKVEWHKDVFEEPRDIKVRRTRETNNITDQS